ncbi:hypothetical protein J2Z26_001854 [Bacillus luteolus]|nr:hypothetical protein [Cytobacillus luteolus]
MIVELKNTYVVIVDWSGRYLTPAGDRGKVETPQTARRGGSTSSPMGIRL